MHSLLVTPITRRGTIRTDQTYASPALKVEHGGFEIFITPQMNGFGYGMTISNKEGDTLFTIGDLSPGRGD